MAGALSVALVGMGYWGPKLLRAIDRTQGLRLAFVCDVRSERVAVACREFPELKPSSTLRSIVADPDVDAVLVATPPATHFELARTALEAGKHVWVEKPLALEYRHGTELVRLARSVGRTLFVDETFLYDPLVAEVRSRIANGQLGRIFHVSLERTGMGRIRRDSNVWWNLAPHDLSILRHVLRPPLARLSVVGSAHVQPGIEDVVWSSLEFSGGTSGHVYLSWLFPDKKARLTVVGEHGSLTYEGRFGQRALTHTVYRLGAPRPDGDTVVPIERTETIECVVDEETEPLRAACAAFRDSVRDAKPAPSDASQSLCTLAALEAGARSLARRGEWMAVSAGASGHTQPDTAHAQTE